MKYFKITTVLQNWKAPPMTTELRYRRHPRQKHIKISSTSLILSIEKNRWAEKTRIPMSCPSNKRKSMRRCRGGSSATLANLFEWDPNSENWPNKKKKWVIWAITKQVSHFLCLLLTSHTPETLDLQLATTISRGTQNHRKFQITETFRPISWGRKRGKTHPLRELQEGQEHLQGLREPSTRSIKLREKVEHMVSSLPMIISDLLKMQHFLWFYLLKETVISWY